MPSWIVDMPFKLSGSKLCFHCNCSSLIYNWLLALLKLPNAILTKLCLFINKIPKCTCHFIYLKTKILQTQTGGKNRSKIILFWNVSLTYILMHFLNKNIGKNKSFSFNLHFSHSPNLSISHKKKIKMENLDNLQG